MIKAITECMSAPAMMNVERLVSFTKGLPTSEIDDLSNLKSQKLYLFSGTRDTVGKNESTQTIYYYSSQSTGHEASVQILY